MRPPWPTTSPTVGKQYWKSVGTPEYVIMFLPAEHMLGVALQAKPGLLQTAFDRKIVLATPSTLMATLRSVSWAGGRPRWPIRPAPFCWLDSRSTTACRP